MKKELLDKLKKINPLDVEGVPIHNYNCQWCAIECARVLLEDAEPSEIPNPANRKAYDPIEERIHPLYDYEFISEENADNFLGKIELLAPGELMLVSLESDDLDHAYVVYKDEPSSCFLIDPDRHIFIKINSENDFLQRVKGCGKIKSINYLNGETNAPFKNTVNVTVCKLDKAALEEKGEPLPRYGTELQSSFSFRS